MQQLLPPKAQPSSPLLIGPRVRVGVRASVQASSSSFSKKQGTETELLPNALRRKTNPLWSPRGFTLGVDLGDSRTGLALGKGFTPRPLSVLELRGQKLELRLLEIAEKEEVDEFVIGLPKSHDGKETQQSNKVRSIAGRLAVRAAERGWRVYLQDEHGTSVDALDFMIEIWCWSDISQCQVKEQNLFFQSRQNYKSKSGKAQPETWIFSRRMFTILISPTLTERVT